MFLPNYDIAMAQLLYPGTDVWLNNPLRPLEACGTSGMKAALNGALNLSILDGWWNEYYDGENGWAIPSADAAGDAAERDKLEAESLYDLIENQIAPRFYRRDADGRARPAGCSPSGTRWPTLSPELSADRMVREYVQRLYMPAAKAAEAISRDDYAAGARARRVEGVASRPAGPACPSLHVESGGLGRVPQVGDRAPRARAGPARLARRPRTSRSRSSTAPAARATTLANTATVELAPLEDDTVAATGRSRSTARTHLRGHGHARRAPARSATTSASCRRTSTSPTPPRWAWSPSRTRLLEAAQPLAAPRPAFGRGGAGGARGGHLSIRCATRRDEGRVHRRQGHHEGEDGGEVHGQRARVVHRDSARPESSVDAMLSGRIERSGLRTVVRFLTAGRSPVSR